MITILSITFPIYAAIALGYGVVHRGIFATSDMRVLGNYVVNIALPALLFNAVASRDVTDIFNLSYMSAFLIGAFAAIIITYTWLRATGVSRSRRAVAIMGTSCPNSGFIGYPVMLLAFPDIAGLVLALNLLVENFILVPICLAIMETSRITTEKNNTHFLKKSATILYSVVKRPMIIALIAGLIASLVGLNIPTPITHVFTMLAASASALALFVIGGSLVGLPIRGNRALAAQITIGKLLLHPTMTTVALIALPMIGLAPLSPDLKAALILSTAMPMFSIYAIFAQEHGHEGVASIALLTSTVAAFFTLSALLIFIL